MNSLLDLRFVIGAFFTIIGLTLLIYGFSTGNTASQTINSWCGGGFLLFGIIMILLSFKKDASDEILE